MSVCMRACTYICILYRMCLDDGLHEPQGLRVLPGELGHSIVAGPGHWTAVPPANPKLAHLGGVKTEIWSMKPQRLWCSTSVPCARFMPTWTKGSPALSRGNLCTLNKIPKVQPSGSTPYFCAQYKMAKFLWRMDKYIR